MKLIYFMSLYLQQTAYSYAYKMQNVIYFRKRLHRSAVMGGTCSPLEIQTSYQISIIVNNI